MEINIKADMRVLYKNGNSNWMIGNIMEGEAKVTKIGLFIPIVPIGVNPEEEFHWAEINQIYTDATKLQDWMKDILLKKEDYVKIIQGEDFHKSTEAAWFSDGEYYYYPVSKFNDTWIMKQPFEYIIRNE